MHTGICPLILENGSNINVGKPVILASIDIALFKSVLSDSFDQLEVMLKTQNINV